MKALTVGGAMIDTIAIIQSDRIERMTMFNADSSFLLLEEGRKTEASEISTHVGGGAVNAAVAMARLGFDVSTLAKLGKDARAETVLARLLEEGISTRWVMRDGRQPTGASVLVSSHDRNAAIFTFRGANTLLEARDLPESFGADIVYVSSLSNESADAFPEIVRRAKAQGALVATNPRVRQLSSRGGAFQDSLAHVDILAINRTEAGVLVPGLAARFGEGGGPALPVNPGEKLPRLATLGLSGGGHDMRLATFFDAITQLGPRFVIVTDGRHGAYVGTRSEIYFCPAVETKVAGTAGAGDAFNATFAAAIALGRGPDEALRAAAINAASVVGYVDTQSGLLSLDEIDDQVAQVGASLALRTWSH